MLQAESSDVAGGEQGAHSPAPPAPAPWPANGYELQTLVGGNWFSTPAAGECAPGSVVGPAGTPLHPGKSASLGCSWRVVQLERTVNASCANGRMIAAARQHPSAAKCFAECPDSAVPNPTSPSNCWTLCLFRTILGTWNATAGVQGTRSTELVTPWLSAFEPEAAGGCPDARLPARLFK